MHTLLGILNKMASRKGLAILVSLYVIVFGSIMVTLHTLNGLTGGAGILDFHQGYSLDTVRDVFDSYGQAGFRLYERIQLLDLVNPAIYSLLMSCVIFLLFKTQAYAWPVSLPLIAGLLDYAENLTLFLLSRSYPELSPVLVKMSSLLSMAKNAALVCAVVALLAGIALWIGIKRHRKS